MPHFEEYIKGIAGGLRHHGSVYIGDIRAGTAFRGSHDYSQSKKSSVASLIARGTVRFLVLNGIGIRSGGL
jgi:hypothetical protein